MPFQARNVSPSLQIGQVRGIDIRLHWSFLLVLPVFAYLIARAYFAEPIGDATPSAGAWAWGAALAIALFGSVLLHELGHSLVATRNGITVRHITLLPIGGVSAIPQPPRDPGLEARYTIAGPLVNFALAIPFGVLAWALTAGAVFPIWDLPDPIAFLAWTAILNVFLGAFNLFLPAFPMDGGRLLRALLARRMRFERATVIAARIGQGLAVLMGIAGFLLGNILLILIAVFVGFGAAAEAQQTQAARRRHPGSGHA